MSDYQHQDLFERQLKYLRSREVNKLIDENYNENAELLSVVAEPFVVKGKTALKSHFKNYLDNLGEFKEVQLEKIITTDDCLSIEAKVNLDQKGTIIKVSVYDAFYLENGKISRHFTGLKS